MYGGWQSNHRTHEAVRLPHRSRHGLSVVQLSLTTKQTNEVKNLLKNRNQYKLVPNNRTFDYLPKENRKHLPAEFYKLSFRLVRFKITDSTYETIVTNLDANTFPPAELKKLYAMRWGIETSFRELKYTIGLLHFTQKKRSTFSRKSSPDSSCTISPN